MIINVWEALFFLSNLLSIKSMGSGLQNFGNTSWIFIGDKTESSWSTTLVMIFHENTSLQSTVGLKIWTETFICCRSWQSSNKKLSEFVDKREDNISLI